MKKSMCLPALSLLALALAAAPGSALADEDPPAPHAVAALPVSLAPVAQTPLPAPVNRIVASDLTILRLNPLGLETQLRLGYQRRLHDSENAALRDNFAYLGTYTRINPAAVRVAALAEVQPLSILNLRFTAESLHFFGTQGNLQSFQSAADNYSDTAMRARKAAGASYAASGIHVSFEPLLQAKLGDLVVRDRAFFGWFSMDLRAGDRVWYEGTLDTAVPRRGVVLANDLDLLYFGINGLAIGPRWSLVAPQYGAADVRPGEDPANLRNGYMRLGLLAAYTFFDRGFTAFNKPTALLITSWYLNHRFRDGTDVSGAMPYVIVGFSFQSDLLP